MRALILIAFLLSACTRYVAAPPKTPGSTPAPTSAKPTPAPRNFVCESFAAVNDKAACVPELTGAGQHKTHTARVTVDAQIIRCAINETTPSVVCSPLIWIPPAPEAAPAPEPAKPAAKGKKK